MHTNRADSDAGGTAPDHTLRQLNVSRRYQNHPYPFWSPILISTIADSLMSQDTWLHMVGELWSLASAKKF
jgi:hypothetical protein